MAYTKLRKAPHPVAASPVLVMTPLLVSVNACENCGGWCAWVVQLADSLVLPIGPSLNVMCREQLLEEVHLERAKRSDAKRKAKAACSIQAAWRGHGARISLRSRLEAEWLAKYVPLVGQSHVQLPAQEVSGEGHPAESADMTSCITVAWDMHLVHMGLHDMGKRCTVTLVQTRYDTAAAQWS